MSLIKSKDTQPELLVRKTVYSLGYRYRLHVSNLPGKPDLVFRKLRKVIFVHGCFWHGHAECALARLPKSRREYWGPKLEQNKKRDIFNQAALQIGGWQRLTIWECELRNKNRLIKCIARFLGPRKNRS